jgi:hypothetical protein
MYTIRSARWGNSENTSVIVITDEIGAVALNATDTPTEWSNFQNWALSNTVSPATVVGPSPLTKQQKFDKWLSGIGATPAEIKTMLGIP